MSGWADRILGGITPQAAPMMPSQQPMPNRMQMMGQMMQAMQNPAAFVKQRLPGIPDQVLQNPNYVLQYMMQNYGVTQQDIQNAANQVPVPRY